MLDFDSWQNIKVTKKYWEFTKILYRPRHLEYNFEIQQVELDDKEWAKWSLRILQIT